MELIGVYYSSRKNNIVFVSIDQKDTIKIESKFGVIKGYIAPECISIFAEHTIFLGYL